MTNKINGIDVSEYFIDVVDEGGSTIDYEILPNSKRLLVEKIFEQNQQLKRLQEENNKLRKRQITKNGFICDCEQNANYKQALEEIREIINEQNSPLDKAISQFEFTLERLCVYEEKYIKVVDKINEVLKCQ